MTISPELDAKFDDIRASTRDKREKYALKFLAFVVPFVLAMLGIIGPSIDKNFPDLFFAFSVLGVIPALLIMLIGGGRMLGKIFDPLDPVEKAFLHLHAALEYTEPPEGEKYPPAVQKDIRRLIREVAIELDKPDRSIGSTLLKEADDLLDAMITDVEDRLLPAAKDGSISSQTLKQLANFLAHPTIDGLRELNSDVETKYEPKDKGVPFGITFSEFFRSQPGHIVQSLVFGFGFPLFTVYVFSVILQESYLMVFAQYAGFILTGIFGLTAAYLGYLAVQRRGQKVES